MTTKVRQFMVSFFSTKFKHKAKNTFFDLAKKHAVKGGKQNRNLSKNVDKILYGV